MLDLGRGLVEKRLFIMQLELLKEQVRATKQFISAMQSIFETGSPIALSGEHPPGAGEPSPQEPQLSPATFQQQLDALSGLPPTSSPNKDTEYPISEVTTLIIGQPNSVTSPATTRLADTARWVSDLQENFSSFIQYG